MRVINLQNTQKLVIKTNKGVRITPIDQIIYIQAENNYSNVMLKDNTELLVTMTLKSVESFLMSFNFVRCHKSYLVNMECINELCFNGTNKLKLSKKHEIPVSREGLKRLKEMLQL